MSSLKCNTKTVFCLSVIFLYAIFNILYLMEISFSCIRESPFRNNKAANNLDVIKPIKVSIGTVVCHDEEDLSPLEEALVLLKSTIISAIVYKTFHINIEFHIFLEYENDKKYFLENTQFFSELQHDIQVDIYFYSVFDIVPKEYLYLLFGGNLRCTYVRIFFPTGLPAVDSILYLDTDVIITGNLSEIWGNFKNMGDIQLVGAAMDIEPDNKPWFGMYSDAFSNIPVPTPRGLNAGVLLMNLTRMRTYQFGDKILRLNQDYSIHKNDQTLLNTLLFYNPYLLYLLPCQYNFRPTACNLGFYCKEVTSDPTGVQIIHQYQKFNIPGKENAFRNIAEAYQNISGPDVDLRTQLLINVRGMYKDDFKSAYDHGKCNGILDHFLFRKIFL